MKKYIQLFTIGLVGIGAQGAFGLEITVSDPHNDKNFSNQNVGANGAENNTVQYNAVANQTWDLESFDLNGSDLSITGGFNYETGRGIGSNLMFPMGDIFVYLGNEAPYSIPNNNLNDLNGPWAGMNNWDYVIRFDRDSDRNVAANGTSIGYSIEAKGSQTLHVTGGTGSLTQGLPWQVSSDTFTPAQIATLSSFNDGEGTHYTIGGLNITSLLALNQSFYLHATMMCGNDVLWGRLPEVSIPRVPDAGTSLTLLGLSLGVLGFVRRRK